MKMYPLVRLQHEADHRNVNYSRDSHKGLAITKTIRLGMETQLRAGSLPLEQLFTAGEQHTKPYPVERPQCGAAYMEYEVSVANNGELRPADRTSWKAASSHTLAGSSLLGVSPGDYNQETRPTGGNLRGESRRAGF